ncbi:glycosyltransferase [Amphibacillus sp. MSJ-3]|uniref:glycosyltransferase n=1 Tax=Amphibacillus sp. MSJ-3 TaxID=2841505 RepID=UPI001C0E9271|nr:glycosyltransferase [Amphibacillus sp. MSJ-3]MBU5594393.1 glycosyltransferase [Amphibacillus sp. MSJ-3]
MINNNYSVLMSVYSKENPNYFKASMESMINQTLLPEEIAIVKDGPLTKELEEIIQYYKINYPRIITIIPLKENVGLGNALNEGLIKCRNELVCRMDTDDISLKHRCEIQVNEFLKDESLDILGSNIDEFHEIPEEVISSRIVPTDHKDIVKFSRRRNPFNHPTVMFKKSSVLKHGGYGNFRRNQDLDLFVRMLDNGCKGKNIDESLLLFRANNNNIKRRKSWEKCSSYIYMIYTFWRRGHSSLFDLLIVTASQLIIFISPSWVLKWISSKFLRQDSKEGI